MFEFCDFLVEIEFLNDVNDVVGEMVAPEATPI